MKHTIHNAFLGVPKEIANVTKTLEDKGFEAYLVGGCVRDLLLKRKPKDWDITTNATPEQIISIFPKTFYENTYGTVGVVNEDLPMGDNGLPDETLKVVEVTPYRLEAEYSDGRRPDAVTFSKNIEDDLKRRDFTINAIAMKLGEKDGQGDFYKGHFIDLYKGQDDLKTKILRTVGNLEERFNEDALRIIRAIRIAVELGFTLESETEKALVKSASKLKNISMERIRDEFVKMLMSKNPMDAIILAQKCGILPFIIPELEKGMDVKQNQAHAFDVWEHLLRTVQHSADKNFPLEVRLTALLHDIGKPIARRWSDEKNDYTFHGHDVVGSRETKKILERLKFPGKTIEKVTKLVRWHMFFSDTEQITLSAVRRMVRNVGQENIWDLMDVRACDRIGTGRPKESPYRLRKYHSMIDEALRDPISVAMLKINGAEIMKITNEKPGPRIGNILHALFEEVLDDPKLNTKEYLEKKSLELSKLSEKELKKLGEAGKDKKEEIEEKEVEEIRKKHWVK